MSTELEKEYEEHWRSGMTVNGIFMVSLMALKLLGVVDLPWLLVLSPILLLLAWMLVVAVITLLPGDDIQ